MKLNTRDLCRIALLSALIAVCAQIAFPLPGGVPFTLQTFGVHLAGLLLGAKKGTTAVVVYLFLGLTGAPVFAQMRGGLGVFVGPTGGFLWTFPLMAWLTGTFNRSRPALVAAMLGGTVINFAGGLLFFMHLTGNTFRAAFMATTLPFLGTTAATLVVLAVCAPRLKKLVSRKDLR